VPLAAVLAALGLAATTAVVCAAVAFRSGAAVSAIEQGARQGATTSPGEAEAPAGGASTSASASGAPVEADAPATRASPAELEDARTRGAAALSALGERYPADTAVMKALALAHARDRATLMKAVLAVKRLLEADPAEATNADVRQVLLRAANGTPEVAAIAFELMSGKMGPHGPDLLYEILIAQGMGKLPHSRAEALLKNEEVRKLATPALLVADELRRTKKCPSKDLLQRARVHGDMRSVHYLKPMVNPVKCGFLSMSRCTPCTGVHAEVRAAMDAIEKRTEAR
jgi:hypothetical protein